jgi:hypothetical protein
MAKSSKPKLLTNNGKSPLLKGFGSSASKKKSPLMPGQKKSYSKSKLPEQAFAIPGFGNTGLTGES